MQNQPKNNTTIITIIVLVVVVIIAIVYFASSSPSVPASQQTIGVTGPGIPGSAIPTGLAATGSVVASPVTNPGADLLPLLLQLKALHIDASIFSDSHFTTLVDNSVELVQQPIGRDHPFAPASTKSSVTTSAQTASTTLTLVKVKLPTTKKK